MIDVVTFKWGTRFRSGDVNKLFRSVKKHHAGPFRFTAITDDPEGVDPAVRVIPLWDDHASVMSPHGPNHPACYRRLKLFAPEAKDLIGERIVCVDLDVVVTGELDPLWNRSEEIVLYESQWGYRKKSEVQPYCGSMFMLTAGSRPKVWTDFDPAVSPQAAYDAGFRGSDQGWFGYAMGRDEATWGTRDGVYCWRNHFKHNYSTPLPKNARMVFFNGKVKPWDVLPMARSWVGKHYGRREA